MTRHRPPADPARLVREAAERFGWDSLRPGQSEAVEALVEGRDVLAVMPTGHGKSAVYQLAATLLDGVTVVVSPLIALQHDQVEQLEGLGGEQAVTVNSAQRSSETREAWERLEDGSARFVFLAPEQLAKEEVVERLAALRPALMVVDEAHCVSSWGHDFRPDYLRLGHVVDASGTRRPSRSPRPRHRRCAPRWPNASACATPCRSCGASTGPTSTSRCTARWTTTPGAAPSWSGPACSGLPRGYAP